MRDRGPLLKKPIIKLVYFDEGSATDYIQITEGGALSTIETLVSEGSESGSAKAGAKIGIGTKGLKALIGLGASAEAEGSLDASFNSGAIAKSIISNTVLTDFLQAIELEDSPIEEFNDIQIEQIPGSIASFSLLTPYLSMFRPGQAVAAGDFDISLDKLDATISKAKGYIEFQGHRNQDEDVILRFNRMALKNNYRPSDLLRMSLTLYAVYVGDCRIGDLVADKELSAEGFSAADNPDYSEERSHLQAQVEMQPELKMYDVLLAGVSARED